jgi:hypothetical protein
MSSLLPDEIAATLPALYSTENDADPTVHVKFFTPDSSWTWYLTEFDPNERLCFGLVIGLDHELGYFSLSELEEVRGPMGLSIERDLYFKSCSLSVCQKLHLP